MTNTVPGEIVREPPGPRMRETLQRLGLTPLRELRSFFSELDQQYGGVSAFRVPWRRFYFLSDPAAIKDVLVTQQHAFQKWFGTRAMREVLGLGLVTSEEPLHRRMRRIVQPAFHRERIAGYAQTMHEYGEAWRPPDGVFDMHAEMMELTLRIASKTLFGVDAGDQAERVGRALKEIHEAYPAMSGPLAGIKKRLLWLPFGSAGRFGRARRALDEIVLDLIAQRRSSEDRGDVLTMLLFARDEDTGEGLSDLQVRDEAMTLFAAGHDTTGNALTWAWYMLAKHPEVRDRLHEELRADPQSPYLDAVISETLRLYSPVWIMGREPKEDVEVQGWRLRKGATVLMSPFFEHRLARYFDDPLRFKPERWLPAPELPQFAYFPFGGGARKCLGDQFAWMEARIVLTALSSRYRFELEPSDLTVEPEVLVSLRPSGPIQMRAL